MSDPFDREALLDQIDGDLEFLKETVGMLDADSPALLEEIRAAAASGDASALIKPAHTLKGMVANFHAGPAEKAARGLEKMGREGQLDSADAAVEELVREMQRLKEALRRFVGEQAS